jgi:hypothetical protein
MTNETNEKAVVDNLYDDFLSAEVEEKPILFADQEAVAKAQAQDNQSDIKNKILSAIQNKKIVQENGPSQPNDIKAQALEAISKIQNQVVNPAADIKAKALAALQNGLKEQVVDPSLDIKAKALAALQSKEKGKLTINPIALEAQKVIMQQNVNDESRIRSLQIQIDEFKKYINAAECEIRELQEKIQKRGKK